MPFFVEEKTDFLNILSLNVLFLFTHYGAQLYREGTKLAKGHLYAFMGHLAQHIRALMATSEPENFPIIFFAPDGAQTVVKRRHKMGKGAPSCLNGVFSPSH